MNGLPIELQRAIEHLLFIDCVKLLRVFAEEIRRRGEILKVDRLGRVEFDCFLVVLESLLDGATMAIMIGKIVPRGGIFRIGFTSFTAAEMKADVEEAKGEAKALKEEAKVILTAELGEGKFSDVDLSVHSFLGGPRVSFHGNPTVAPFGHVLLGAARVSGSVFGMRESETEFALQPGGGVDVWLRRNFGIRVGGDYRRIFFEGEGADEFRIQLGVVVTGGSR